MPIKRFLARPLAAIALSVLSFGFLASAAQAGVVRFNFALDFISGPLDGQSAFGSFDVDSSDCAALVCSGTFTPSGPANPIVGPTGTLLAFSLVVDGITFTLASDDLYPDFPSIELEDNVLTRMDFMNFGPVTSLAIYGSPFNWGGSYTDAQFDTSLIGDLRQIGSAQAIPEPATVPLVTAALFAGLLLSRRRSGR